MRIRLLGQYVHVSIAVLSVVEALMFYVVLTGAVALYSHGSLPDAGITNNELWPRAAVFSCLMVLSLLALGLYSVRQRARAVGIVARMVLALLGGMVLTWFFFNVIPYLRVESGVLALTGVGAIGGVCVSRLFFQRFVSDEFFKRRVLVYGAGRSAAVISNLRRRADRRGFSLVGFMLPDGESSVVPSERVLTAKDGISELCARTGVDEVVVAMEDRRRGFPTLDLLECRLAGVDVTELLTFLERETGRVRIDILNPSWMIFGEGFRRDTLRLLSSRILDLIVSTLVIVVSLPILLLTALAIKVEEGIRAPIFYKQMRVGFAGKPFPLLKFRSMRTDAERSGPQWAQPNDPRITRVGAFLRRSRIDELPQMLNVLAGHMSCVGPRPERPEFVADLSQKVPYYEQRHCVKPGITGWAQLCYPYGASDHDSLEKLQYDLYYIKNNSLLFDLAILLQTAEVVFMGKGAR